MWRFTSSHDAIKLVTAESVYSKVLTRDSWNQTLKSALCLS